jgi:hypothetical protein
MSIKAFCALPITYGYQGDPASGFAISVNYTLYNSDMVGIEVNGSTRVNVALDATPAVVYQQVYTDIVNQCTDQGWPTPAPSDIYAYVPVDFSTLIPPAQG